jgi:hypothetical protein
MLTEQKKFASLCRLSRFAPGAAFRLTRAAVNLLTPRAGGEALSADNMEALVADVMALPGVEAGFAREGVEGFHYRVECQRKRPGFLSSLY